MKILLVNPPRYNDQTPVMREHRCEGINKSQVLPPYSLLQIAALVRNANTKVSLIDANGQNMNYDQLTARIRETDYDILIFRFTATTFDWDMKTAGIFKKYHPGATTIGVCWGLGNFPEEVLKKGRYLDIFVMREYEVIMPSLISAISKKESIEKVKGTAFRKDGDIHINEAAEPIHDYDSIPLPAYDLLPSLDCYYRQVKFSSPFMIIYTSQGCPFSCKYCLTANTKWMPRSAERVLAELRHLKKNYNIKTVTFFDEVFTLDRKRVTNLAEAIRDEKLNIKWICDTRVDLVDREMLATMRQGGCDIISFGIESGSQRILDNLGKGVKVEQAENAIRWAKEAGIKVNCTIMLGSPGENWDTVNETIGFLKKTLPNAIMIGITTIRYGTKLHETAIKEEWVKDVSEDRSEIMLEHRGLTGTAATVLSEEDLLKARQMMFRALYYNRKWIAQNIKLVFKNRDFRLGIKFVWYALKQLFS